MIQQIQNGQLLDSPRLCPEEMCKLMLGCWRRQPHERLSMREMVVKIQQVAVHTPNYLEIIAWLGSTCVRKLQLIMCMQLDVHTPNYLEIMTWLGILCVRKLQLIMCIQVDVHTPNYLEIMTWLYTPCVRKLKLIICLFECRPTLSVIHDCNNVYV